MQTHAVEHHDVGAAADDQTLDEVEALQFGLSSRHGGQIPPGRRRRPTNPPPPVQHPSPQKDPADGPDRWERLDLASLQFPTDGLRAKLAQGTGLLELFPHLNHQVFDPSRGRSSLASSPARAIRPVDPVQTLILGSSHPDLDGPQADAELFGDRSHREALPNGSDDRPLPLLRGVFGS